MDPREGSKASLTKVRGRVSLSRLTLRKATKQLSVKFESRQDKFEGWSRLRPVGAFRAHQTLQQPRFSRGHDGRHRLLLDRIADPIGDDQKRKAATKEQTECCIGDGRRLTELTHVTEGRVWCFQTDSGKAGTDPG